MRNIQGTTESQSTASLTTAASGDRAPHPRNGARAGPRGRSTTPTSANRRPLPIRRLDQDEDTDDDVTVSHLSDDDTQGEPDFP